MMQRLKPSRQVGINAHLLSRQAGYRSAGIHGYIVNLINHLPHVVSDLDLRYRIYVGEGQVKADDSFQIIRSAWPTGRPPVRILWEQLVLAWQNPDLMHCMAFVAPLVSPWPTVVTVYDTSFVNYPETFNAGRRAYLDLFTRLSCQRAERVIAISESTRRDLVKQWNLPADRINVAYPGVGDRFKPLPRERVELFRKKRGLPEQFILHLGTLQPRKNLVRLVQAFELARARGITAKLVLAGGEGWQHSAIKAEIERLNLQSEVILPGYIPSDEIVLWYNAATILAFPSLYEGFGLPIVESMACGTPVITSNLSSMPEAAGTAAVLIDPTNTESLAYALHQLLKDKDARENLQTRGFQQAARFTWQKTAASTIDTYRQVLESING